MPFQPPSLDTEALRRIAKNIVKTQSSVVPGLSLQLSEVQELLARGLRHKDWHSAVEQERARRSASVLSPEPLLDGAPFSNPADRAEIYFFLGACALSGFDLSDGVQRSADLFSWSGQEALAQAIRTQWGPAAAPRGAAEDILALIGKTMAPFSVRETMHFSLAHKTAHANNSMADLFSRMAAMSEESIPAASASRKSSLGDHPLKDAVALEMVLSLFSDAVKFRPGEPLAALVSDLADELERAAYAPLADHLRSTWLGAAESAEHNALVEAIGEDLREACGAVARRFKLMAQIQCFPRAVESAADASADLLAMERRLTRPKSSAPRRG